MLTPKNYKYSIDRTTKHSLVTKFTNLSSKWKNSDFVDYRNFVPSMIIFFFYLFKRTLHLIWFMTFFIKLKQAKTNLYKYVQPSSLKGQSNEIFDRQFISSFKPAWATDEWVKIFSTSVSFSFRPLKGQFHKKQIYIQIMLKKC